MSVNNLPYWSVLDGESPTLIPIKFVQAHRYLLAMQRLLELQEQNPTGSDKDG
jgi:hypothetical protein